ncbi:hypothetical protein BDA99DRAFT_486688 [Phascolomyces articulosus]|uniref:HECT-type E3 ubiquitin transferase n=1 Tax=Phascolomyces articulosus TaxID=60185 RepID=A0AAD5JSY4_9FUNG|nr:hypothetical protein BDA99DRAFT_486688 [Phascolomyces articulosus]
MAIADTTQQHHHHHHLDTYVGNEEDEDDEEEQHQTSPFSHLPQHSNPFLDSIRAASTTTTQQPDFEDNMIRMQFDLFTGGGGAVSGRFRSILAGLTNNEASTSSQMAALQELSEILSISNEDTLIGMFPCDSIVRELTRILNYSETSSSGLESNTISQQDISMMDEESMIAFALNNSEGGGNSSGNIETMTLACQCLSNLLHALPSSASNIVAHGAIEILCQKLEPSDYIDLPEQALSVLEKLAVQYPRAVVQGGGLNAALKHFHFFTIHLQRSAIKTAASCFRNLDVTSNAFTSIIEILPTLIETLSYPDNTVVEDTCLCWARLIDSCRSSKEHMERIVTTDLLQKMVHLIPVPGRRNAALPAGSNNSNSNNRNNRPGGGGGNGGAFGHLLRIFRTISKYSPQLSYQLLELDLVACFYQIMTGSSTVPTTVKDMPINFTLDNKWRDSMLAMMGILVDLLPPLPIELLNPDRFLDSEPISSRTRSARYSHSEGIPPLVRRRTGSSPISTLPYQHYNANHYQQQQQQQVEAHIQLLKSNPTILQRISLILIPLLTEVYTTMANLPLRELVTHVLVKLVHFSEADTLRVISMHIPLSVFLADILAQKDHATLVVDALYQTELLFNKLPDIYSDVFEIEGVLHEINIIANMSLEDTTAAEISEGNLQQQFQQQQYMMTMPPFSSLLMNSSRLPGYRSSNHHMINNSEVGIGQGPTRRYVILLAQNFLRIYNSHVWHQQYYHHHRSPPRVLHNQEQEVTLPGQYQTRLDKLQLISHKLMNCTDNSHVSALKDFLLFLNSSSIGISGFELSHSGIIDALLFYLTGNNSSNNQESLPSSPSSLALRRNAFENLIMQHHPSVLKTLIDRLLESLNRSETFRITTPMDSFNDVSINPMAMLNRRIRVRLTGEGQRIPFEHRNLMASVPIAACLKNLEDYLMSRMGSLRSPSSSQEEGDDEDEDGNERNHYRIYSGDSDEDGDDDDVNSDDDSICDPEMVNPFDEEQGMDTDNEEDMLELNRNAMASGEQMIAGASSTTVTATRESFLTRERANQNAKRGHWKIQFYIRNTLISSQSTIYGIIHEHEQHNNRSAWVPYYRLSYKLVWISEDEDENNNRTILHDSSPTIEQQQQEPSELSNNPTCLKALQLSSTIFDLLTESSTSFVHKNIVNIHSFVNRKLTGKVQRQLEEPLIVASHCLPQWTYWFMRQYPFLFPFETRYQFLQSTSYGYSRLMARWQSLQMRNNTNQPSHQRQAMNAMDDFAGHHHHHHTSTQPLFHRVARYKAKIPRTHLLQSTTKILDQCMVGSHATLEVQFTGEEGTGLGPTLEFYAAMSKEFCKKSLNMWRNNEENSDSNEEEDDVYVSTKHGLFPMPMMTHPDTLNLFQTLGHFVAKAMVDFRLIDMPFSPAFFKVLFSTKEDPFTLIKEVDPVLGKSLDDLRSYVSQKKILETDKSLTGQKKSAAIKSIEINGTRLEDLCLDFTLPGHPDIQLKKNGENIPVTIRNLEEYLDLLVDKMVGSGIKEQMNMFRQGFNRVFNVDNLKVLTPNELVALFGNSVEDWSYQTISNAIHADHGFTLESQTVQNLLTTLAEMKEEERRDFLQFTTGSPRLPIGGWQALRPVFTVVRKQCEPPLGADDYLPSVMTCANYLKLPDYSSKHVLQQRLLKSMREGKNCFLLS